MYGIITAAELRTGDRVAERDGFVWEVEGVMLGERHVLVTLRPEFTTILREKRQIVQLRRSTRVRLASAQ